MTATSDFDRLVASWLQADGPSEVRADVVDASLAAAGRVGQRRGVTAVVLGPGAWPAQRRRLSLAALPPAVRVALLVGLTLAAMTGIAVVGSQLLRRASEELSPRPYRGVLVPAADMAIGRVNPVVVSLEDGRVLIAAGLDGTGSRDDVPAEVFDPATGTYQPIARDAPHGQGGGSGVQLPDGRVFVIVHDENTTSSRAYLVDPATMTSRELPMSGSSNAPIFGVSPSLALVGDGRVLIAGGYADVYRPDLVASALLFDPATESFTPTGSMGRPRWRHSMTTLPDGRVLVAGGEGRIDEPLDGTLEADLLGGAEIYDPATGVFLPTGGMLKVRGATVAVPLADGRVIVLPRSGSFSLNRDGSDGDDGRSPAPVEIYDPATGTFRSAGVTPGTASSATLLRTGEILLVGYARVPDGSGWPTNRKRVTWAVVFDPATGLAATAPSPRALFATPAQLADGRVLFAGGLQPAPSGEESVPWVERFE